jgi:hypothetical protein
MPGERRRSRGKRSRKSRGLAAAGDAAVMAAAPAEEDADAPNDAQVAAAPAEADAPPSRPTQPAGQLQASPKPRRSGLPRWVDFLTWAAGAGVTFALQSWLHHREEKRLEADERRVREEWARAAEARLDVLLTSRTVDDTAYAPALWGPPQGAAWCARPRTHRPCHALSRAPHRAA